ncbi:amino acid/amide ABC transporter ATP-binding protein 2, HAAT family [Salinihabitans flavidus]|uniref:Amino acid/amide ABC transporter ATP-binding protein 2, HAAT family n=1 Tax=Salinihabitans flavidus TaxID=569882 RepID=A0A1H8ULU7_9RHOB|nr:ABC transporter ATP-binding protein [Salinihabitans flavidus]SEP04192.1 amino acid/amide ABC transporter ATP-binding protein 2, HAAT family [Salinihabitans flavidus]
MTTLFTIDDLHVSYGKVEAVHGISLELDAGRIVSVIGPNGAGKSTLLSAAIGLLPSRGRIMFDGSDISGLGVEDRVERGLCLVPETRELFGEMSVLDNLLLGAFSKRPNKAKRQALLDHVYKRFPRLAERRHQHADTLSGGERQMLALGRALMSEPRLLMLDEPSLGLAPLIVQEILSIVTSLRADGVSILLVEQNALAALESSDYGYVLESGEVALHGDSQALKSDERVFESYLGGV